MHEVYGIQVESTPYTHPFHLIPFPFSYILLSVPGVTTVRPSTAPPIALKKPGAGGYEQQDCSIDRRTPTRKLVTE
jgi:hypothetical protein